LARKVFISHTTDMATYPDPHSFIDAALDAVNRADSTPVDMRFFGAQGAPPAEYCRARVRECDVYVAVIGFRYGSMVPKANVSYTELEFLEAGHSGLPRLVFLLDPDAPVPPSIVDRDRTHIEAFRERVYAADVIVQTFRSSEQLEMLVYQAITSPQGHQTNHTSGSRFDRDRYLRRLVERYRNVDLEILTPLEQDEHVPMQLRSVFVPQHVRAEPPPVELSVELRRRLLDEGEISADDFPDSVDGQRLMMAWAGYRRKPVQPVLDVLTHPDRRLVVVLGDPGSGKSTLLRYLTLSLAGQDDVATSLADRLPILVELRRYAEPQWRSKTILDFIDYLHAAEGTGVPTDSLERALSTGNVVMYFDGLDELFEPTVRESVTTQIANLSNRYAEVRMVVTSRVIGYRRSTLASAGFQHFTIQELNDEQIRYFVTRWYQLACPGDELEAERRKERMLDAVRQSDSVRDLAGNPLLLTILSIIGRRQELPRDRRAAYDHAASVLIQHWDVNRHIQDARIDMAYLDRGDRLEMLRRVARQMQGGRQGRAGNYISGSALLSQFESFLRDDYDMPRERAKPVAQAILAQLRERNFILGWLGADLYGFVHRALLEYLCASDIVHRFQETQELTAESLSLEVFGAHSSDPAWHEVLLLVIGMINEEFSAKIIESLLEMNAAWSAKSDEFPQHLVLAVRCIGEVRKIGRIAAPAKTALDSVIDLLDRSLRTAPSGMRMSQLLDSSQEAIERILPTLSNVGESWPGRDRFLVWFRRVHDMDRKATAVRPRAASAAARALAFLNPDRPDVRRLLQDQATDPDHDWSTRAAALQACATVWRHEPGVLELILDRATNDRHRFVRATACETLAAYYSDNTEVARLVRERTVDDHEGFVRAAALEALVAGWATDPATNEAVHQRACSDADEQVRRTASRLLAEILRPLSRAR
jgi:hypothetical protein